MKLSKTPQFQVQAVLTSGNATQTLTVPGLEAKRWEHVSLAVSRTKNTVSLCVASFSAGVNCSHVPVALGLPGIGTSRSFVNVGAPMMEILDAKVDFQSWTLDHVQRELDQSRDTSPYIACKNWDCIPANQEQQVCLHSTETVLSGSLVNGSYNFVDIKVTNVSYRAYLQLKVLSGDADLMAQIVARKARWTAKQPGSDFMTLNLYSNFYRVGDLISVTVSGYSDVPAVFTLTVIEVSHVGNRYVPPVGAFSREATMNEEPQMDIEAKDALLSSDLKSASLGYSFLLAIFVLVGLGVCVCNSKVPAKRRLHGASEGFIRLDA